jgi:hypothetical protein
MARADKLLKLKEGHSDRTHFVIGQRGDYDILEIDLRSGEVRTAARLTADKVHAIAPLTALGVALTVENNNRRLQVIDLD